MRMDNVGLVVDDMAAAIAFFVALGMELEGEAKVGGPEVDRLIALEGVDCDVAMVRTPDGHSRIELMRFNAPLGVDARPDAPVNAFGYRRIMFNVEDIEGVRARLLAHGAKPMGEMMTYGDNYRLCNVRGPEGIIVALAEKVG